MTSKENTVKIKADGRDYAGGYDKGDIFEARIDDGFYYFKDSNGDDRYRHESEFTLIPDEPAIEVGSEWVNHKGNALTVEYVGKYCAVCTWNDTGKEFASPIKNHLKFYKPKPKTVTMYFYKIDSGYMAREEEIVGVDAIFTREIELP